MAGLGHLLFKEVGRSFACQKQIIRRAEIFIDDVYFLQDSTIVQDAIIAHLRVEDNTYYWYYAGEM